MSAQREIQFQHLSAHPDMTAWIEHRLSRLEQVAPQLTRCRVAVDLPHRHHRKGRTFDVRIELNMPGREMVIRHHQRDGGERLESALLDAFRVSERQLRTLAKVRSDRIHQRGRRVA